MAVYMKLRISKQNSNTINNMPFSQVQSEVTTENVLSRVASQIPAVCLLKLLPPI